jgi:hypothetical protein
MDYDFSGGAAVRAAQSTGLFLLLRLAPAAGFEALAAPARSISEWHLTPPAPQIKVHAAPQR